jgi:hypothetical protein
MFKTTECLPPEGKYVICKHNLGTWSDTDDQDGVNYIVAKMVKGISEAERALMPECERKRTYKCGDVIGNNKVPYAFHTFGPQSFFGQDIVEWDWLPT